MTRTVVGFGAAWGLSVTLPGEAPGPDRVEAVEVILAIGAEGGSLTIVGVRVADGWRFRLVRDETTLHALLSKADRVGMEFWHQSDWVDSFDTALALLDRYPWHRLYPLQVHPDFRRRTWAAAQNRFAADEGDGDAEWARLKLDRWQRLCHGEADH